MYAFSISCLSKAKKKKRRDKIRIKFCKTINVDRENHCEKLIFRSWIRRKYGFEPAPYAAEKL